VKRVQPTIELEPLDSVEGEAVGSTMIDTRMVEHIEKRLQLIRHALVGEVSDIAEQMVSSDRFQTMKHSYPNFTVDKFPLEIRGLEAGQDFPQAGIRDSALYISRRVLGDIFDEQVKIILSLIGDRLAAFWANNPGRTVSYLILSGGFSNSPYVFQKLKEKFGQNAGIDDQGSLPISVLRVLEP
jgi:hypothetical protein